jgi:hypothetical protein
MKRISIGAFVVATLVVMAAPAAAQVYPPSGDTISIGSTTLSPGESTTLSGTGADAGAVITASFFSQPAGLGSTTADAAGAWSMGITIPSNATPGAHTITATGAGYSASITVTIVGAAAPAAQPVSGAIAFTGSDTLPLVSAGTGLLIVGFAFAFAARRRLRLRTRIAG